MKTYKATHMIKYEDLNHHESLYAGRAIEWMIEASFIAAGVAHGKIDGLVYKNTHKFDFIKPVIAGEIITYESTVVRVGSKSLTMRVGVYEEGSHEQRAEGYTTFVCVDEETGKSCPCDVVIDETDDAEELAWREEAAGFFK